MQHRRDSIHLSEGQQGFEEGRPFWRKLGAVAVALLVACGLLFGYAFLNRRNQELTANSQPPKQAAKPAPEPEAQIFQDEARLKAGQAIISGKVLNVSQSELRNLSVEIELKHRTSAATQRLTAELAPSSLGPNEEGRYSLSVLANEWSSMKVTRLLSAVRPDEIAFRSAPGEKRPPEPPPGKTKVNTVQRPRPSGEEFINTEDSPERVP